jgi:hypothetical protein
MTTNTALIAQIREHAVANYEAGWDVVVEAYTDQEIAEVIGKARTLSGAIKKFSAIVEAHNERVADARISAGEEVPAAPTRKAKAEPTLRPCACAWTVALPGQVDLKGAPKAHREAADYDAETDWTFIELGCGRETASIFAPGHDARLKGLAITAARFGGDLSRDGQSADPWTLLSEIAPNLLAALPPRPQRR